MKPSPLVSLRRVFFASVAILGVFAIQYLSISNTPSPFWMGGGCPYGVLFSYFPVDEWRLSVVDRLNPILGFPFDWIVRKAYWHTPGHWSHTVARVVCPLPWDSLEVHRLNYLILTLWNTASWFFAFVALSLVRIRLQTSRSHPRLA